MMPLRPSGRSCSRLLKICSKPKRPTPIATSPSISIYNNCNFSLGSRSQQFSTSLSSRRDKSAKNKVSRMDNTKKDIERNLTRKPSDHLNKGLPTVQYIQDQLRALVKQFPESDFIKSSASRLLYIDPGSLQRFAHQWVTFIEKDFPVRKRGKIDEWTIDSLQLDCYHNQDEPLKRRLNRKFLTWLLTFQTDRLPYSYIGNIRQQITKLLESSNMSSIQHSYPKAREINRKFVLHVGPTNSGKTHNALVALAKSSKGVYAGPLRLLANEIFNRFNKGLITGVDPRPCNLLTGDESITTDANARLLSCTVEMVPLSRRFQVAVIDEFQMITDPARGNAWTSAILGIQADEIHLCGEENAIPVIKKLAKLTGDQVVINHYHRLSPLGLQDHSISNDLSAIQKGDCIVDFSRKNLYKIKGKIEDQTGLRVALAYGSLPPDVRAAQAEMFNHQKDYDVIVGSDALGMGLNLKIKRIIFNRVTKFDGNEFIYVPYSLMKQIAGRAGRYGLHSNSNDESVSSTDSATTKDIHQGLVTTMDQEDLPYLRSAMASTNIEWRCAIISPPVNVLREISYLVPQSLHDYACLRDIFAEIGQVPPEFSLALRDSHYIAAPSLDRATNITLEDKAEFIAAPRNLRDDLENDMMHKFIKHYMNNKAITTQKVSNIINLDTLISTYLFYMPELFDIITTNEQLIDPENVEESKAYLHNFLDKYRHGVPSTFVRDMTDLLDPEFIGSFETAHRIMITYAWLRRKFPANLQSYQDTKIFIVAIEQIISFILQKISQNKELKLSSFRQKKDRQQLTNTILH